MHANNIHIPGYNSSVEYTTVHTDYNFIAQHNYVARFSNTDIVIRGWYERHMMEGCDSLIAIWRPKSLNPIN